jgi:glycosyltransferase involved in cell wall biosynthesis
VRIGLIVTGGVDRSGRERVTPTLLWLIERLARRHDVHVFVLAYYPEPCTYALLGATVHDLGRVTRRFLPRRWSVIKRLAHAIDAVGRFDVLHAYMGIPGLFTTRIARRLGVPLVVTLDSGELVAIDDIDYGLQRRWRQRRFLRKTVAAAAATTVSTQSMAMQRAIEGLRVEVIPIGVDPARFPLAERTAGPPWRLLRVASLNRVKDFPMLVETMRILRDRDADVHLDIVGEDTLGGAVQAHVRQQRLDDRITFHGWQPTDQLASFYAQAHLHVVSSRHEAAGVTTLEAACTHLSTVGTDVGYVADWSPDRAVAVPVRDARALADAIIGLLQDPVRRRQLAAAARTWTLAHDADWTASTFDALYARVAADAR